MSVELTRKDLMKLGLSNYLLNAILKDIAKFKKGRVYIYQPADIKYSISQYLTKKGIKTKTKKLLLTIYDELNNENNLSTSLDLESEIRQLDNDIQQLQTILEVTQEVRTKENSKKKSIEQLKIEFYNEKKSLINDLEVDYSNV